MSRNDSKASWRSLLTMFCGRVDDGPSVRSKKLPAKQKSLLRLSFSDVSNSTGMLSPEDLSISLVGSNLYVFTLAELKVATQSFSMSNFLGEGGFGPVYKGFVDEKVKPGLKAQSVAVKLLDLEGVQGHKEWLAEVIFLGQLRHPHLVKLIGYCCEDKHRVIVYEFMARGSLENHLFKKFFTSLPWLTRLKIAVGAARGLAFLHEMEKPVIYRDFKASNILLDSDYKAKLSDFGLAKDGPEGDDTHVSTRVMGTEGYAAPEYIMTGMQQDAALNMIQSPSYYNFTLVLNQFALLLGHLTAKSDVYSFGVVLLELLTGRRSVDKNRPSREQNLVEWARPCLNDVRKLSRVMDPSLEGQYSTKCVQKAATVAYQCLSQTPKSRPQMSTIVETLEPLLEMDDMPIGPFIYTVSAENGKEEDSQKTEVKENGQHHHGHRHKLRSHRSGSHSETVCQDGGNGLYRNPPRHLQESRA